MARRCFTGEQIFGKLSEAEVGLGQGETVLRVYRSPGATGRIGRWSTATSRQPPRSAITPSSRGCETGQPRACHTCPAWPAHRHGMVIRPEVSLPIRGSGRRAAPLHP